MFTELYNQIAPACCYITVFLGDEKISEGTGFAYSPNGEVLTAAHVAALKRRATNLGFVITPVVAGT